MSLGKERQKLVALLLKQLAERVESFSDRDMERLVTGKAKIDLKVVRVRGQDKSRALVRSDDELQALLGKLQLCETRDACAVFLEDNFPNKASLAQFARFLDVPVLKRDRVGQLLEKVIESTVGAIIRSQAIRGREK